VVAKAGYGTVCEAIVAGKPMVFPPRTNFAEHRSLAAALKASGGGLPASRKDFDRMRIEPLIRRGLAMRPGRPPIAVDGAKRVARIVADVGKGKECEEAPGLARA
jgi:predicted glycosyltransferase